MRYWLSAGRGDFNLTPEGCLRPEFYCAFYTGPYRERDPLQGVKVATSRVPNKPGMFAEMKSVCYMQNVHNAMGAHEERADYGIFIKANGEVAEGPTLNVGMVSKEGVIRTPPFEECLAGCTMTRIAQIVEERAEAGEPVQDITGFEQVRARTCALVQFDFASICRTRFWQRAGCRLQQAKSLLLRYSSTCTMVDQSLARRAPDQHQPVS